MHSRKGTEGNQRATRGAAAAWMLAGAMATGAAQATEPQAWRLLDEGNAIGCAQAFAHTARTRWAKGDRTGAARNGYWAARCAMQAGERKAALRWRDWVAAHGAGTWHGKLVQGGRTNPRSEEGRWLVRSVIVVESNGEADAVSHKGALGLMQVMPATGREVLGDVSTTSTRRCLLDARCNVAVGSRYLATQLRAFEGNLIDALAAYNAGPARAKRWRSGSRRRDPIEYVDRIPIPETREYVSKVLARLWEATERPGERSRTRALVQRLQWPRMRS